MADVRRDIAQAMSSMRRRAEGHMTFGSRCALPDDVKAHIARMVRSIQICRRDIGG